VVLHVIGLAALGSAPMIDQSFLARELGAVTQFAMSERILTSLVQICTTFFVLPRIPVVGLHLLRLGVRRTVTRELQRTLTLTLVIASVAALVVLGLLVSSSLGEWSGVAVWTLILLVSLPANVGGIVATRLVVATNRARAIPFLAATGVLLNLVGDILGYAAFGAVGILASTVVWQYLLLLLTAWVLLRAAGPVPAAAHQVDA
jgi:hypothetical protein